MLNFNYLINCFNLCFTTKQVTHYYMLLLFQSTFVKTKSKNLYVRFDSNQPKFYEKNCTSYACYNTNGVCSSWC